MGKIPVSSLISDFRMMLDQHWAYGAETKRGQVDCSGAFVWSYKQHGHSVYHGSNRIAREEVIKLIPIEQANIVPGMAAFKHRTPLDSGYALPSSYKTGGSHYNGDLNDYYHIGLVDEDTKRVLNAQGSSTGFVASDISKNWTHVAYLSQVDYEDLGFHEETQTFDPSKELPISPVATVVASSGSYVKMRAKPSKTERTWWNIPVGTVVEVEGSEKAGWVPIRYSGKSGYMMADFLEINDSPNLEPAPSDKKWAVLVVDLTWDEANVLLEEYPGRSFPDESNG